MRGGRPPSPPPLGACSSQSLYGAIIIIIIIIIDIENSRSRVHAASCADLPSLTPPQLCLRRIESPRPAARPSLAGRSHTPRNEAAAAAAASAFGAVVLVIRVDRSRGRRQRHLAESREERAYIS